MGTWGLESYANDDVYDILDQVSKDPYKITSKEIEKAISKEIKKIIDEIKRKYSSKSKYAEVKYAELFLGVVMWGLDCSCIISIKNLKEAKELAQKLLKLKKYLEYWNEPEKRKKMLKQEIKTIEEAIKRGGKGKKKHIKGLLDKIYTHKSK